jgi:hypothetical protein
MLWVHREMELAMTFALTILAGLLCMPLVNHAVAAPTRKDHR